MRDTYSETTVPLLAFGLKIEQNLYKTVTYDQLSHEGTVKYNPEQMRYVLVCVCLLTLSCPAVSQIRNLCSSFPLGTVLVKNDALQKTQKITKEAF